MLTSDQLTDFLQHLLNYRTTHCIQAHFLLLLKDGSGTSRSKPQVGTRLLLWWISITNRNDFLTRALKTMRHARRRLPSRCLNMDNVPVRVEIEKKKKAPTVRGSCSWWAIPSSRSARASHTSSTCAPGHICPPVSVRITLLRRQHPRRNHGGHQEENADAEVG